MCVDLLAATTATTTIFTITIIVITIIVIIIIIIGFPHFLGSCLIIIYAYFWLSPIVLRFSEVLMQHIMSLKDSGHMLWMEL